VLVTLSKKILILLSYFYMETGKENQKSWFW